MVPLGRREFLAGVGTAVGVTGSLAGVAGASQSESRFDPVRDGFGFPNWASKDTWYPEHEHVRVDPASVEARIRREWKSTFAEVFGYALSNTPGALLTLLSRQLSVSVNQLAASNGHCYGMTYAAQRYFERPGDLPDEVDVAAEVSDPEIPLGSDEGPIGDLIDHYQTRQLLDIHAWLGRRRMFRPKHIDFEAELAALVAVIDEFGTAGVTLVDTVSGTSHQVLAYDYTDTADGAQLALYDPNYPARQYRQTKRTFTIDASKTRPVSGYAEYDAFVFNRWDRAIRSNADTTSPVESNSRDDFGHLLKRVVRVAVDTKDVSLAIVDPDGNPVGRNNSGYMDRRRTDVWATRYRYDAPPGRYRLAVVATRETDYEMRVQVAGLETEALDTRISKAMASGEVHEYVVDVPERGTPSIARVYENPTTLIPNLDPASVAVGVASGAALTYLAQSR
ncbi:MULTISPECIES: hypothetical protein [Haloferax]|uniref:Uncharacterized protein n=1 Tax=Haloferax marinum TaxID=2666143 RepID=A0A6A8GAU0_9EURY|nr:MULTISPECIES: hypothetical protein [Haloferax]KAB1198114.1 hypothetical protein Hfx1150_11505 [Haloferax sp. CBA1150]MRW97186.1 hypothetical protein [Haloferax marinum]